MLQHRPFLRTDFGARLAAVAALAFLGSSCAKLTPSGFWTTYKSDLISKRYSDQGPWGGTRWIYWEGNQAGTFTASDTTRFAASNDWSCQKPLAYSAEQMRIWQYSGQPVFVLPFGPADQRPNDDSVKDLPRFIEEDSIIIQCESGWTREEPGTGKVTAALGYIQINAVGTRLAVYHLWGEI
jgi:hypothetical protein